MKFVFEAAGTAEEVSQQLDEAGTKAVLEAKDPDEGRGVGGVVDAISTVLTTVDGDRQATVKAHAEVRGAELTTVYLDIVVVPSGAVQQAKADADRVNVRQSALPNVDEHLAEE